MSFLISKNFGIEFQKVLATLYLSSREILGARLNLIPDLNPFPMAFYYVLKVRKSGKKFIESSILPKQERKFFENDLQYISPLSSKFILKRGRKDVNS